MKAQAPSQRVAFSVALVAQMTGTSRAFWYPYVSSGELPSILLGGRRLIRLQALEEFLAAREEGQEVGEAGDINPASPRRACRACGHPR